MGALSLAAKVKAGFVQVFNGMRACSTLVKTEGVQLLTHSSFHQAVMQGSDSECDFPKQEQLVNVKSNMF